MSRRILSAVLVLLVEGYLYVRYAQLDAEFHFWLHGLLGGALGMAAVTAVRLASRRRPHGRPAVAPWGAGGAGHLYSAVPDVLFLSFGVLHVLWMDVFAFHITVHFIPADIEDLRAHPRIALCPSIPVGEPAAGHHAHRDPPAAGWAPRR